MIARFITVLFLLATPAAAHDFYTDWRSNSGTFCCNNSDCRPVESRTAADGFEVELTPGEWTAVPKEAILSPRPTPDGGAHVCVWAGKIQCFLPGMLG